MGKHQAAGPEPGGPAKAARGSGDSALWAALGALVIGGGYGVGRSVYGLSPLVSLLLSPALFALFVVVALVFIASIDRDKRRPQP